MPNDRLAVDRAGVPCVPVPERLMDLVPALVPTLTLEEAAAALVGAKATWNEQEAPPATEPEHVLFSTSNGATTLGALVIVSAMFPALLKLTVCALDVAPTATLPKLRLVGEMLGDAPRPVPETLTPTLPTLVGMVNDSLKEEIEPGLKPTCMEQEPPAARIPVQVLLLMENGVLTEGAAVIENGPFPVFENVRVWAVAAVLTATPPKLTLPGDADGTPRTPEPDRLMV